MKDPKTKCNPKSYDTENVYGFCNIVTDFALIIMPIPLLWKMHMNFQKKIGVAAVFATGTLYVLLSWLEGDQFRLIDIHSVFAVAIVRQYIAYNSGASGDMSWGIIDIKIWMAIEVNIAIIVACLPALTPLFKRIPLLTSLIPSSVRSKFSHASAMQRNPWPQKLSGPQHSDLEQGSESLSKGFAMHTSWRTPRAWRDAERRAFGDSDGRSQGSNETIQSVQAMYHAR
ncbi:MAG: hypothetical protein Q9213_007673 [Squamulea squamosa]